jgi:hypothetical protein
MNVFLQHIIEINGYFDHIKNLFILGNSLFVSITQQLNIQLS